MFWYLYVLMFVLTFVPCVIVLLFICQLAFMYESVHEHTSCSRVVWTPSIPLKYYRVIQHFCYFSSYSIDVITWHSPTETKLLDFPFKTGNANDTLVISFKKHAYLSVCKSLEKVFLYKIIHPIFLSSHIYYPSPSICEVVKFDCKVKKLPWERKFCREKESFAVRKKVLPWERKFCRDTCGPPYNTIANIDILFELFLSIKFWQTLPNFKAAFVQIILVSPQVHAKSFQILWNYAVPYQSRWVLRGNMQSKGQSNMHLLYFTGWIYELKSEYVRLHFAIRIERNTQKMRCKRRGMSYLKKWFATRINPTHYDISIFHTPSETNRNTKTDPTSCLHFSCKVNWFIRIFHAPV